MGLAKGKAIKGGDKGNWGVARAIKGVAKGYLGRGQGQLRRGRGQLKAGPRVNKGVVKGK